MYLKFIKKFITIISGRQIIVTKICFYKLQLNGYRSSLISIDDTRNDGILIYSYSSEMKLSRIVNAESRNLYTARISECACFRNINGKFILKRRGDHLNNREAT